MSQSVYCGSQSKDDGSYGLILFDTFKSAFISATEKQPSQIKVVTGAYVDMLICDWLDGERINCSGEIQVHIYTDTRIATCLKELNFGDLGVVRPWSL